MEREGERERGERALRFFLRFQRKSCENIGRGKEVEGGSQTEREEGEPIRPTNRVVEPALRWPNGIDFLVAVECSEREGRESIPFRSTLPVSRTLSLFSFKCKIHVTLQPSLTKSES